MSLAQAGSDKNDGGNGGLEIQVLGSSYLGIFSGTESHLLRQRSVPKKCNALSKDTSSVQSHIFLACTKGISS